jgi:transcription-repair coupling factor (superfamily II helicase)
MNLGLIIIDEEHRFGVLQKEKLKTYSSGIDVLTLTATPIPRTLDLAVKGLFQLSHLFTPPAGRKEVQVFVERLAESHHLMKSAIENELNRGGQAFVIVPYVSNITETQSFLQNLCPQVRVLIVHGGLPDIEERITKFQNKEVGYFNLFYDHSFILTSSSTMFYLRLL